MSNVQRQPRDGEVVVLEEAADAATVDLISCEPSAAVLPDLLAGPGDAGITLRQDDAPTQEQSLVRRTPRVRRAGDCRRQVGRTARRRHLLHVEADVPTAVGLLERLDEVERLVVITVADEKRAWVPERLRATWC